MKTEKTIKRFDDLGRIAIPKAIRKQIFDKTDTTYEPVEIFVEDDKIILQKISKNVEKLKFETNDCQNI